MDPESSQRVGQNGSLLLQDFHLIDLLAHFDRERIPERVVHAKGAGAYGKFEVTDSVADLTSIDMLSHVGKKTKCIARFSTVGGGRKVRLIAHATLVDFLSNFIPRKAIGTGFSTTRRSFSCGTHRNFPSSFTPRSAIHRPT